MTTRSFTRCAVAGALLATGALVPGATTATAENSAQAPEGRREPIMFEIDSPCSPPPSSSCAFDLIGRISPGSRIEVRNISCFVQVVGDERSNLPLVNLTKTEEDGRSGPRAFLVATKTTDATLANHFVVAEEVFYFAETGEKIGINLQATGTASITTAICTLSGEVVSLQ